MRLARVFSVGPTGLEPVASCVSSRNGTTQPPPRSPTLPTETSRESHCSPNYPKICGTSPATSEEIRPPSIPARVPPRHPAPLQGPGPFRRTSLGPGFPSRRAVTLRHRGPADAHRDRGRDSDASRVAGRHRATAQRPRTASSVPMRRVSRTGRCAARCRPSQGTDRSGDWRREAGRQLRDQLDVPARRTPNGDLHIQLPAESPGRGRLTKRSRRT